MDPALRQAVNCLPVAPRGSLPHVGSAGSVENGVDSSRVALALLLEPVEDIGTTKATWGHQYIEVICSGDIR